MSEEKKLVPKLRFPQFQDAEGWESATLEEVAEFVNEKVSVELVELVNYISTENVLPDYSGVTKATKMPSTGSVTRYRANDTLVSNIRPYFKKVWFSNKDGGASNDVIVIRAKPKLVTQYFPFLLKNDSFIDYVMKGAKGVKMPRGDFASIKKYPTFYPTPPEQQKIADCLSSLNELIAAQARKVNALKTHKKGLMQQLFPREGETQPRLRFPEFRDAGEWGSRPLGELGEIVTGKTPSTKESDLWGGNILFITPTDISEDKKYQHTAARTVVETKSTKVLPAGTVVYTCIASIGKMALTVHPSITNQQINAVVPNENAIGEFIYYVLANLTPWIKTIPASSTLAIINKTDFSKISIVHPRDIGEQQRITNCLTALDELFTAAIQELDTLKTHKKALMQQLFPLAEAVAA